MTLFRSFVMGGFESSCHRREDGLQLDVVAASGHQGRACDDYALLARHGIRTVRDCVRWHLVERTAGIFDWSSWLPMLEAAQRTGTQVIWDLCHYGLPPHVEVDGSEFPAIFARYAQAAASLAARYGGSEPPVYCVVNEISYWAWCVDEGRMYPQLSGGGAELKRSLIRAAIAAIDAIRMVQPDARFVQPEPLIHVAARRPEGAASAENYRLAQFETFDMLCGRIAPELGGTNSHLDILGVNFYFDNQWFHDDGAIAFGSPYYRPFSRMLAELHGRYGRPILVTETGAEGEACPSWLRSVASEVCSPSSRRFR